MSRINTKKLVELADIISRLRAPDGCPWDREQTHSTLKPFLIEEAYETAEAIDSNSPDNLKEELGDLLLHIFMHAEIACQKGEFNINDVVNSTIQKLYRRHPHVFGDVNLEGSSEVITKWIEIKKNESVEKADSILNGIPKAMPALLRALALQERASQVGFDWDGLKPVFEKIVEEFLEFKNEYIHKKHDKAASELGDILFAIVNLARFLKINPEESLQNTNNRFIRRFQFIETELKEQGKILGEVPLEEMDKIWEKAKKVFAENSNQ